MKVNEARENGTKQEKLKPGKKNRARREKATTTTTTK